MQTKVSRDINPRILFFGICLVTIIMQMAVLIVISMRTPRPTTGKPPELEAAVNRYHQSWNNYLELIGRQDRSANLTNPGLRQKVVTNWGTKIAQLVDNQIKTPGHPAYQQRQEVGLTRAEENGSSLLMVASLGVTSAGCSTCEAKEGIIVTYNDPNTGKETKLRMPSEALQLLAIAQSEAAGTVRTHPIRPNYQLGPELRAFNELQDNAQRDFAYQLEAQGFPLVAQEINKAAGLSSPSHHSRNQPAKRNRWALLRDFLFGSYTNAATVTSSQKPEPVVDIHGGVHGY